MRHTNPFSSLLLILLTSLWNLSSYTTLALYESNTDVITSFQSSKSFRDTVLESDEIWMVQFYAPWCGHCQSFHPRYVNVAKLLKGIVRFGVMDATSDKMKRIAGDYNVQGFPTLKVFMGDSGAQKQVKDVNTRDPNELINFAMKCIQETVQARASSGASSSGGSSSSGGKANEKSKASSKSQVISITSANIQEELYNSPKVAMVAFIAPWCGHCKALIPEYERAAQTLTSRKADVVLATVDATVEEGLARQFQVQGYPTIKVFPGGINKNAAAAIDYTGGREIESIVSFLLEEVDRSGVPKEIPELISQDILLEECGSGTKQICVLAALPHILDSGVDGRNKYRDILTDASKSVRGMSFSFFWFEGGNHQLDLESALDLTFGYPALAAYSIDKGAYAVQRSSFTEVNIRKFLLGITSGRQGTTPIKEIPRVVTAEPWDGLEGVPFEEESLEDIMGWDDDDDEQGEL